MRLLLLLLSLLSFTVFAADVSFLANSMSVNSSDGNVTLVIKLSQEINNRVVIPFEVSGSLKLGYQHNLKEGKIFVDKGSRFSTINFNIYDQNILDDKYIDIRLMSPQNANLGKITAIRIHVIKNSLKLKTVNFVKSNFEFLEESTVNIPLIIDDELTTKALLKYEVLTDLTSTDFKLKSGEIHFEKGSKNGHISFYIPKIVAPVTNKFIKIKLKAPAINLRIGQKDTVDILIKPRNKLPTAVINIDKVSGFAPLLVNVNAIEINDEDGHVEKVEWITPDGRVFEGENQRFEINKPGNVNLILRLTDDKGGVSLISRALDILKDSTSPSVSLNFPNGQAVITKYPSFYLDFVENESGISIDKSVSMINGQIFSRGLEVVGNKIIFTVLQDSPLGDGDYILDLDISDRAGNISSLRREFSVDTGEVSSFFITGTVVVNDNPLAGANVELVSAPLKFKNLSTATDEHGRFKLEISDKGNYRINVTKEAYTIGFKNIDVFEAKGDYDTGVIRLSHADALVTEVDLAQGGQATNSDGSVNIIIPEGAGVGSQNISITNFKDGNNLPARLPELSAFTYAVVPNPFTIDFEKDIEFVVDNDLGFPVGTDIVVGVVDPELGRWVDSGVNAKVVSNSFTKGLKSGTGVLLPTPRLTVRDLNQPSVCSGNCRNTENKAAGGPGCNAKVMCCPTGGDGPGNLSEGSLIETKTGFLELDHSLPSIIFGNQASSPTLVYRSKTVYPSEVLTSYVENTGDSSDSTTAVFTAGPQTITGTYKSLHPFESVVQRAFFEAKSADGKFLESGTYNYKIQSNLWFKDSVYATALYFGAPGRTRLGVTVRVPVTISTERSGRFKVVNNRKSIFGAGWSLGLLEKLHLNEDRTLPIMLEDRNGDLKLYNPYIIAEESTPLLKSFSWQPDITNISHRNGITLATDCLNNVVYRLLDDGSYVVVAGNGRRGFSGDGRNAIEASLNCPMYAYPAEMGGFYIADSDNYRIRKVSKDGIITTIAGNGVEQRSDFDHPAISSSIGRPTFVTEDKLFSVFFLNDQKEVNFINPRGIFESYSSQNSGYVEKDFTDPKQIIFDEFDNPVVVDSDKIVNFDGKSLSSRDLISLENKSISSVMAGTIESVSYNQSTHSYYVLDSSGNMYAWNPALDHRSLVRLTDSKKKYGGNVKTFTLVNGRPYYVFSDSTVSSLDAESSGLKYVYVSEFGESDEVEVLYEHSGGVAIKRNDYAMAQTHEYGSDGWITSTKSPFETIVYSYIASGRPGKITSSKGWSLDFTYNTRGQVQSITDKAGRVTNLNIDENGDLVEIINPDLTKKLFEYNDHLVSKETKEDGEESLFKYQRGRLIQEIYSGNRVRNFEPFDLKDVLFESNTTELDHQNVNTLYSVVPDKSGKCSWKIYYDRYGNILKKEDCLGKVTTFENQYFEDRHILKSVDPDGVEKEYTYSIDGKIKTSCTNGVKTHYEYNPQGQQTKAIDAENNVVETIYNELGLPISVIDQYSKNYSSEYDEFKNLKKSTNPLSAEIVYSYDENNNLIGIKDALGNSLSYERNSYGQITKVINPMGHEQSIQYDIMGRVVKSKDQMGFETEFKYDSIGRLIGLVDANLNETSFEYGTYGLISKEVDPLGNSVQYFYNENESVASKVLGSGKEINYLYDLKNRLLNITSLDDVIGFEYHDNNKLAKISRNEFKTSYQYDEDGKVISEKSDFYNLPLTYAYNTRGIIESKSFGELIHLDYLYDKRGSLSQVSVTTNLGPQKTFNWIRGRDVIGRPIESISFNDMITKYSYDKNDQLLELDNLDQQDKIISKFDYSYNEIGNITSLTETRSLGDDTNSIFNYIFGYDASSRLIESSFEELYALDPLGNRVGAGYLHNANNQLLESPEWSFSYDLDGNLIQKSHKNKNLVYNYSWSALGKLVQLDIDEDSLPSKSLKFKYDGLNRRVEKQYVDFKNSGNSYVKRFIYDGEDIILELDQSNKVKALFVHGEGVDDVLMMIRDENDNELFEDDEVYAYTKDHLGSIREIVDFEGTVKQRYSYSAYGETKIAKINSKDDLIDSPYGFTGRELDLESGDMYYRARYYNPSTGRFLSEDPIGFFSGDTNHYRYVSNNPLNLIDPFGLSEKDVQRMRRIFRKSVQRMNKQGLRRPGSGVINGWVNNFQSNFGKKLACGGQAAETVDDIANDIVENGPFDDNWQVNIVNPNPFHQNVNATSSNPNDPPVTMDPWMNSFSPSGY